MNPIRIVFDLLAFQLKNFPSPDALGYKQNGNWVKYSTAEYINQVNQVSLGLLGMGITKGDRVAIVSENRPEWNFIDFGLQQIGAVSVPVYPNITIDDYKYIFNDAQVKIIFASSLNIYEKIAAAAASLPFEVQIFSFDSLPNVNHWSKIKKAVGADSPALLASYTQQVEPEDLLTLIYTSGTTGRPKGVMLTHNNLVANFTGSLPAVPVDNTARALSFLPLCHIYERMINYLYMRVGVSIYYAESMEKISDNLKEVQPNIFVTVPRLLEKVYDKIVAKGMEQKGIKRSLFFWALNLGLKYDMSKKMGFWYDFQLKLANKIIFSKWRAALGGQVKVIVSGGAALQPRLARVFWAAGLPVLEGYGLTETSPVIAVNRINHADAYVGTVGIKLENVEIKIAEDGEILTRGPAVMKGYYNKPELTAEVIDAEGWFHTGDVGQIIEGKFLKITDRKKEIFKTSGGKYIAPQMLENILKESLVIEQAMVIGENQKFAAALITPAPLALEEWCKDKKIPYESLQKAILLPEVIDKFNKEVEKCNEKLAQYEKIKKIKLVPHAWAIDSGELTPTLKLKRKFILEKYAGHIEQLYQHE